ncbi:MAG: hypothetical protein LBJ72_09080 [Dysgonamonadaceae bacterium]|jgi:hypothetical protein|nr:hypothetical protein [Dysgonamonadaceae bacterium]
MGRLFASVSDPRKRREYSMEDILTGAPAGFLQQYQQQSNNGYGLQYKYSRFSYMAMKNYYTRLQIAHLINQHTEKSREIVERLKAHPERTGKHPWNLMMDALI